MNCHLRLPALLLACLASAAGGCSLKQTVNPAPADLQSHASEKVAIIENPLVRMSGFDDAIQRSLERCGFTVEMLPKGQASSTQTKRLVFLTDSITVS